MYLLAVWLLHKDHPGLSMLAHQSSSLQAADPKSSHVISIKTARRNWRIFDLGMLADFSLEGNEKEQILVFLRDKETGVKLSWITLNGWHWSVCNGDSVSRQTDRIQSFEEKVAS